MTRSNLSRNSSFSIHSYHGKRAMRRFSSHCAFTFPPIQGTIKRCVYLIHPYFPNPKAVNLLSSKIKSVDPGSPGQLAGILPGDTLVSINGKDVVDVLDYKFYSYDPRLKVELADANGNRRTLHIRKGEGQDLGLEFETYLMDHAHRCANNCVFCFVDQMPKGLRDTLYFKDDDDRLSFLLGNYVTLTNLSPREIQRIIDLRISPINVSVHTTDPKLRVELMGNRNAGKSIDIMRRLAEAGIHMNCQIVACPGLNDGPALARSMRDLTEMRNGVTSVAIVPVGLTKYRDGLYPLRSYTAAEAGAVMDQVEAWSAHCRTEYGEGMFWCSDEFYLIAGRPIPEDEFYEDYCQLENGVGMLRLLQVEFKGALMTMDEGIGPVKPFAIATGMSAGPLITQLAKQASDACGGIEHVCVPHPQRLFRAQDHRFWFNHRQRPHRPASGQTPGTAAAAAQFHVALSSECLFGRRDGGAGGTGAGRAADLCGAGRVRPAGCHVGGGQHPKTGRGLGRAGKKRNISNTTPPASNGREAT